MINARYHKIISQLISCLIIFHFFSSSSAQADASTKVLATETAIREEMKVISKELGVTCTECHDVQNFTRGANANFHIAKKHIEIVKVLRENGFDGKHGPLANCFMCHRGKLHPDYTEELVKQLHRSQLKESSKELIKESKDEHNSK